MKAMMALCGMEETPEQVYAKNKYLIRSLINAVVVNNPSVVGMADLQQVGAMALIDALRTYDASLGSFQSYVRKCIWNALLKEANSFSGPFTTDEKTRRRANLLDKLKKDGLTDDAIMARLGLKNHETLVALQRLVNVRVVDVDDIDIQESESLDKLQIFKMLGEMGLTDSELTFVQLTMQDRSIDDLITEMGLSRSRLYAIKASIREKILTWGHQ